ncbi:DUF4935 domain-containing protein [Hymenobacter sp. BT188]|nr:DUF4935 domain-containing protein [Hymenobacter sp. BT188]
MVKLLIDTCVWLDLAKNHEQSTMLSVIEEGIQQNEISLLVPQIVLEEFERNKDKIIRESSQSLSGVFKRVREAVSKFGDPQQKQTAISQLNDVSFKLPGLGEAAAFNVQKVEKLLKAGTIIDTSNSALLKAAQRAIDKRAPFHRHKNSMNDAVLMELYGECIQAKNPDRHRFAFVTHNKSDFSDANGNERNPHPDFTSYFSKLKSLYFISLGDALYRFCPELTEDTTFIEEWEEIPRTFTELLELEEELRQKVWYNRHQVRAFMIEEGRMKLIEREEFSMATVQTTIIKDVWEGAKKGAEKLEKLYGKDNLGPYDDFEWGMLSGKLSAIRWVMGDDWDNLDT